MDTLFYEIVIGQGILMFVGNIILRVERCIDFSFESPASAAYSGLGLKRV